MTQLYRIDKRDWDSEDEVALLINEWAQHQVRYGKMVQYENITQEEADVLYRRGPQGDIYHFAALYRKNGTNYIWRGRRVPMNIRYRLQTMMYAENAAEQNEGTVLLYKAQGNSRENNQSYYPLRMSNNRYVFVLGSVAHFSQWLSENNLDDDAWRMWASEHLLDWESRASSGSFMYERLARSRYNIRSQYAYLMDQFINLEKYSELYQQFASDSDMQRGAYCVWQDGVITQWKAEGQLIHPKI